jgi:hypothetical protein
MGSVSVASVYMKTHRLHDIKQKYKLKSTGKWSQHVLKDSRGWERLQDSISYTQFQVIGI